MRHERTYMQAQAQAPIVKGLTMYDVRLADETTRIIDSARARAKRYSNEYAYFWIGTGHVLIAMLEDHDNSGKAFLVSRGIEPRDIVDEVDLRVEEYAMASLFEDESVKGAEDGRMSKTLQSALNIAADEGKPVVASGLLRAMISRPVGFSMAARILADGTSDIDEAGFERLRA